MIEDLILSIGSGGFGRTLFGVLEGQFAIRQVVVHRYSKQGVEALAVEHACVRARNPYSGWRAAKPLIRCSPRARICRGTRVRCARGLCMRSHRARGYQFGGKL